MLSKAFEGLAVEVPAADRALDEPWPLALRQWYGRAKVIETMASWTSDCPIRPEPHPNDPHRLILMYENQGVCTWSVMLGEGRVDDPPVDVSREGGPWIPYSRTFTDFLRALAWDCCLGRELRFMAQASALDAATLVRLRSECEEDVQTTGWPGSLNLRLRRDTCCVLLWDDGRQCDWAVACDVRDREGVVAWLLPLSNLGAALYGAEPEDDRVVRAARGR